MGIFDKLTDNQDIKLTPKGALALAAITMFTVDGSVEDDEALQIIERTVKGDEKALEQAFKACKDRTFSEHVQLVCSTLTDQKQRLAAIAVLLDIAMADGVLTGVEKDLMTVYINSFQISEEAIKGIVDVIALKNDFSVFG